MADPGGCMADPGGRPGYRASVGPAGS